MSAINENLKNLNINPLSLIPSIEFNIRVVLIHVEKKMPLIQRLVFSPLKLLANFLFHQGGHFLGLLLLLRSLPPFKFKIRKLPSSDVGMTLGETTLALLKSRKTVYEINGSTVSKPSGSQPVLSSGSTKDMVVLAVFTCPSPVKTKCDYALSPVTT